MLTGRPSINSSQKHHDPLNSKCTYTASFLETSPPEVNVPQRSQYRLLYSDSSRSVRDRFACELSANMVHIYPNLIALHLPPAIFSRSRVYGDWDVDVGVRIASNYSDCVQGEIMNKFCHRLHTSRCALLARRCLRQ